MNRQPSSFGFSEVELLVAISVIAIFATLAVPSAYYESGRSPQIRALANAKQIGLACKLFASDYKGNYPTNLLDENGKLTATPPSSSNDALSQLIPDYIPDKKIFWLPEDHFYCSPNPPESPRNSASLTARDRILAAGENHWAYVTNLSERSNPNLPLIADPTIPGTTEYSFGKHTAGGTWRGKKAIVIRVDTSGVIENVNQRTMTVSQESPALADIFQAGQKNWLGPENKFLNPKFR